MEQTKCFGCGAPALEWFCTRSCGQTYRQRRGPLSKPKRKCITCKQPLPDTARRQTKFCSRSCSARHNNANSPNRRVGKFAECVGCGAHIRPDHKRCAECRECTRPLRKEELAALIAPPENEGRLEITPDGHIGQFYRTERGVSVMRRWQMFTAVESLAWWRMWRLIRCENVDDEEVTREEVFAEAVKRIVWLQKNEEDLGTWQDRLSRLWRYAVPLIGSLAVSEVRPPHIKRVLVAGKTAGLGKESVRHLKADLSSIFTSLVGDDLVPHNIVKDVPLPKRLKQDKRRRVQLTDPEFEQLVTSKHTPPWLRLMCCTARMCGGMRTSDLHAWDWEHVETSTFKLSEVPRPKTDDENEVELAVHELPLLLQSLLREQWLRYGRPKAGPIFPVRRGPRTGERQLSRSYVRELRRYLRLAGCTRIELFENTAKTLRVDFHSFRRAYNTALADIGVSERKAMALADHSDSRVHGRYVDLTQRGPLSAPSAALPAIAQKRSLKS